MATPVTEAEVVERGGRILDLTRREQILLDAGGPRDWRQIDAIRRELRRERRALRTLIRKAQLPLPGVDHD